MSGAEAVGKIASRSPDAVLLAGVRRRLAAWSGGATLVILVALGALFYGVVARSLEQSSVSRLQARGDAIATAIQGGRPVLPRGLGLAFGGPHSGTVAFVIGPTGEALGPPGPPIAGLPDQASAAAARAHGTDARSETVLGIPVRVFSRTATRNDSSYVVQVVADREAEAHTLAELLTVLALGGLAAVAAAAAAGFFYAGGALVPIRESLRHQREFAADASHELRTPLSVIGASVDHLRRHRRHPVESVGTALDDIEAEVARLTLMVDDLLLLARADSGAIEMERYPIDLADIAADAMAQFTQLAAERGVSLLLDPMPAPTVGDPARLRQVVTILVDNAIRHSPGGGRVTVLTRHGREGATLAVEDQGPGVPPENRQRIFHRFWRAPGAVGGGSGLGLAIALWIIERHGGSISVDDPPSQGARFTVQLPG